MPCPHVAEDCERHTGISGTTTTTPFPVQPLHEVAIELAYNARLKALPEPEEGVAEDACRGDSVCVVV